MQISFVQRYLSFIIYEHGTSDTRSPITIIIHDLKSRSYIGAFQLPAARFLRMAKWKMVNTIRQK